MPPDRAIPVARKPGGRRHPATPADQADNRLSTAQTLALSYEVPNEPLRLIRLSRQPLAHWWCLWQSVTLLEMRVGKRVGQTRGGFPALPRNARSADG